MLTAQPWDSGPPAEYSTKDGHSNSPEGLLLYDTDTKSFWYVKNSVWTEIGSGGSGWSLTGNAGTDPDVNFIGTTDNTALKFKVNSQLAGLIDPTSLANTSFGFRSLARNTTGSENTALGYEALDSNTTASFNTANGFKTLHSNTTGWEILPMEH